MNNQIKTVKQLKDLLSGYDDDCIVKVYDPEKNYEYIFCDNVDLACDHSGEKRKDLKIVLKTVDPRKIKLNDFIDDDFSDPCI